MGGVLCGGAGPWPPLPPALEAEMDRNRAEEEPEMWDLAQADKACREELAKMFPEDNLPDEVEPCQERLRGAGGQDLGASCQPLWRKGSFWCALCDQDILIMRAVKDAG